MQLKSYIVLNKGEMANQGKDVIGLVALWSGR